MPTLVDDPTAADALTIGFAAVATLLAVSAEALNDRTGAGWPDVSAGAFWTTVDAAVPSVPAAAFGTPVIFLSDGLEHPNQKSRLEGLDSFFTIITSRQLKLQGNQIPAPK